MDVCLPLLNMVSCWFMIHHKIFIWDYNVIMCYLSYNYQNIISAPLHIRYMIVYTWMRLRARLRALPCWYKRVLYKHQGMVYLLAVCCYVIVHKVRRWQVRVKFDFWYVITFSTRKYLKSMCATNFMSSFPRPRWGKNTSVHLSTIFFKGIITSLVAWNQFSIVYLIFSKYA